MGITGILILAVSVALDALAVSFSGAFIDREHPWKHAVCAGFAFGGFQFLMPLIGYFIGISFADFVCSVDHWIAFVLLGIIGGNMIHESFDRNSCDVAPDFSVKAMLPLAVATSIDALAVGVSMAFLRVNIWQVIMLIGITTGVFSFAGIYIGKFFGCRYKSKAEFIGGFILMAMGLKILLEHTLA
jgi:putative Mn2+ efflux pump MntP